jgi:MazG family protein
MNKDKLLDLEQTKRLCSIVEQLRDPNTGCPWDIEQTHESLVTYLQEESAEVIEAIDLKDDNSLKEELGDLLLQVVLNCQIASERQAFNFEDVAEIVSDKMIRRHPHVFKKNEGDDNSISSKEVLEQWEVIKAKEKKTNDSDAKIDLLKMPKGIPALLVSERIGEKTARVNFDWDNLSGVIEKVEEEYKELKDELNKFDNNSPISQVSESIITRCKEELGDCLFSLAQLSRWLGFSAESVLRETNLRFKTRFNKMNDTLKDAGIENLNSLSTKEKEFAWKKAKP